MPMPRGMGGHAGRAEQCSADCSPPPAAQPFPTERRAEIHAQMDALLTELRALDGDAPMPAVAAPEPERAPELLSLKVAAFKLGVSVSGLRRACAEGRIGGATVKL